MRVAVRIGPSEDSPYGRIALSVGPLPPTSAAADQWLLRFRSILVAILGTMVAGIACLAFYTSFEAIRAYAMRSAGIAPEHGWAIPLLVDSFIIVATGADLWFTTSARKRQWWEVMWPKMLLGGAALVSFILNVAHANHSWAARGVAAIPPAALVLGVELLMMVLRRATALRVQRLQEEQEAYNSLHSALPGQLSGQLSLAVAAQPALGAGSLGAVPPGESVPATVAPAEPRPAEVATVEEQPLEPARRTTAGEGRRRTTLVVDAGSELAPRTAAPLAAVGKPLATGDLRASAARRNGSRIPAPYLEASRILDEREDGATLSPENLVEALAAEGVVVDLRTARGLLRELRPAVTALQSLQRPSKASPSGGGAPSGHPAGTANATSREAPAQPAKSGAAGKPAPAGDGERVDTSTGRPIGLVQSPKRSTR